MRTEFLNHSTLGLFIIITHVNNMQYVFGGEKFVYLLELLVLIGKKSLHPGINPMLFKLAHSLQFMHSCTFMPVGEPENFVHSMS